MVITVTFNPAFDKTLRIDNFELGNVNRASESINDIGGKGINVSKVLKNLGIESTCIGFLGENLKNHFINCLDKVGINTDFIKVNGSTRTNVKVVDYINKTYTDINEFGPEISIEELKQFFDKFKENVNENDIVVLSGGLCSGLPKDIYKRLCQIAKDKKALVIMDADGDALKYGLDGKPYIIKPNNYELKKIFNLKVCDKSELIGVAKGIITTAIKKVIISLEEEGLLLVTDEKVCFSKAIKVNVKSTVGAGDSMVAEIIYAIENKMDDATLLKFGASCGASAVKLEGTKAPTVDEAKEIFEKIEVIELEERNYVN